MDLTLSRFPAVSLTACISPMTNQFSLVDQFAEAMEIGRMFGIQRFVLYNKSASTEVKKYIDHYVNAGLAVVIPWHPENVKDQGKIVFHGQQTAQTDCLYRNLYTSRYVTFIDLDEVLVLRRTSATSLVELITRVENINTTKRICDFQFRHAYFHLPSIYTDDLSRRNQIIQNMNVQSLVRTLRSEFYPIPGRSKYVATVKYLLMPTVHNPRFCVNETSEVTIPTKVAALHHYRKYPLHSMNRYVDRTMYNYMEVLLGRLRRIHTKINGTTDILN